MYGLGPDVGGGAGQCSFQKSGVITLYCLPESFRVCAERICFAIGLAVGSSAIAVEALAADGTVDWPCAFVWAN